MIIFEDRSGGLGLAWGWPRENGLGGDFMRTSAAKVNTWQHILINNSCVDTLDRIAA